MRKYYVIIMCLLFIAGVTSCATDIGNKSVPKAEVNQVIGLVEAA